VHAYYKTMVVHVKLKPAQSILPHTGNKWI